MHLSSPITMACVYNGGLNKYTMNDRSLRNLSLLLAKIVDQVLVHLRPLFRDEVEEVVLAVALDDDLVVARHRGRRGELLPEELGGLLEVDPEGPEALHHRHALPLAARRDRQLYLFLRAVRLLLLDLDHSLAAPLLPLGRL